MRWKSSAVISLVACNLGWPEVVERDAHLFDAAVDAPFACPAIGTAPAFVHDELVQELAQHCGFYTLPVDGTRAMAVCDAEIVEGPADGTQLRPAPGLESSATSVTYGSPRLTGDGTTATTVRHTVGGNFDVLIVARDAIGWHAATTILSTPTGILDVSQTTEGPNAHVLVDYGVLGQLHELVDTGAGWQDVRTHMLPDFLRGYVQMSPDGLRAWWTKNFTVYYADRASIDDAFVSHGAVAGTDGFVNGYLTPDCGYLYFNALDRIWRAPRAAE